MERGEWRKEIETEVAKITSLNLTCLPQEVWSDMNQPLNQETIKFTAINEIAKPGGGYELIIERGGIVRWCHYDSESFEFGAQVTFVPRGIGNRLLIEVPKGTNVEIREITKLP
jgi:hypothetical protein